MQFLILVRIQSEIKIKIYGIFIFRAYTYLFMYLSYSLLNEVQEKLYKSTYHVFLISQYLNFSYRLPYYLHFD